MDLPHASSGPSVATSACTLNLEGPRAPAWMSKVLLAAAAYNIVWGAVAVVAPQAPFRWMGMEPPAYPMLWQCIGMIVGVYGVGYALAAFEPFRHWPIVLVGLLGKVLGPIGFVWYAAQGQLPWAAGLTIITNDLIWWVPFFLILRGAARSVAEGCGDRDDRVTYSILATREAGGSTLLEQSFESPLLIVFLRHFGCTFCREALADLRATRDRIEASGTRIALVHMAPDKEASWFLTGYGLSDVLRVSDPERELYRAFALRRGTPRQLFGLKVWLRGWQAGVKDGHGLGTLQGDGFQMPGAFLVHRGRVIKEFIHISAADRPDYVHLATVPISEQPQPLTETAVMSF